MAHGSPITAKSAVQTTTATKGRCAIPPILQSRPSQFRQHPQSPIQTTTGTKWRGITPHLRNQRNPRFRQHAQSPIQTTTGTKVAVHHTPICENQRNPRFRQHAQSPIQTTPSLSQSEGDAERSERRGCPGRSGRATSPLPRRERVRVRVQGEKRGRGASAKIRAISPIRGSDNPRNPRYRQRPGKNGARHHSPSAKICVI